MGLPRDQDMGNVCEKSLHQYALNVEKRGKRQKRTLQGSMSGVLADFYSFTPLFGILYKHWFSTACHFDLVVTEVYRIAELKGSSRIPLSHPRPGQKGRCNLASGRPLPHPSPAWGIRTGPSHRWTHPQGHTEPGLTGGNGICQDL